MVGNKHVEADENDKMHGVSSILPRTRRPRRDAGAANRLSNIGMNGKRARSDTIIMQDGGVSLESHLVYIL